MNNKHQRNKIRLMERYHLIDTEMRREIEQAMKGIVYHV